MTDLPSRWFHGSPYCCFDTIGEYRGSVLFMSDSRDVALEYLRKLVGSGEFEGPIQPTLYELELRASPRKIFDLRNPEHASLWPDLAKLSREVYGEDGFSKKDVIRVPRRWGSSIDGELPSFGLVLTLLPLLEKLHFVGALFGEGSQGGSLAIVNPQKHVCIVQKWSSPVTE